MITLTQAQEIARKHSVFPDPDTKARETDSMWIFGFYRPLPPGVIPLQDGEYIGVSKADGKIKELPLPDKETFAILKKAKVFIVSWD